MPHFDSYPTLYWFPVYALCWGVLWLTVRAVYQRKLPDWRLFGIGVLGLFFLLRLPSIVFDGEINPDESQMITQALTLRHDPVYFRSVDGTTGGPLDSYFLIIPSLIGLPFDFITAHLTAFCLLSLYLFMLFVTARLWFGDAAARLALLPFIFMLGLTQNGDFLHYNSELIALLLLGWSFYLYATLLREKKPSIGKIALIGLLAGMVPFGKLQAVPMAATVALFVALDTITRRELTRSVKLGRVGILVLCGVAFPLLVVGLTKANGVYDDLITFYFIGNFQYGSGSNQLQSLLQLPTFFKSGSEFDWLVKLTTVIWLIGLGASLRRGIRSGTNAWQINAFVGVLFVATLFAITRTGSQYPHHLYFLTAPLLFLLAYGWQQLIAAGRISQWVGGGATAVFLALFGVRSVLHYREHTPLNPYPSDSQSGWIVQPSPVSKKVAEYAQPGEKLVVWGWRCDYYVQTGMQQGVAENHTIRSAFGHPMRSIYQKRYVANFLRSFPPVFVDAVGNQNLWMTDRKTQGYEIIEPLRQFVAAHYKYMGLVNDTRIYVRYDRINGLKPGKTLATAGMPTNGLFRQTTGQNNN